MTSSKRGTSVWGPPVSPASGVCALLQLPTLTRAGPCEFGDPDRYTASRSRGRAQGLGLALAQCTWDAQVSHWGRHGENGWPSRQPCLAAGHVSKITVGPLGPGGLQMAAAPEGHIRGANCLLSVRLTWVLEVDRSCWDLSGPVSREMRPLLCHGGSGGIIFEQGPMRAGLAVSGPSAGVCHCYSHLSGSCSRYLRSDTQITRPQPDRLFTSTRLCDHHPDRDPERSGFFRLTPPLPEATTLLTSVGSD